MGQDGRLLRCHGDSGGGVRESAAAGARAAISTGGSAPSDVQAAAARRVAVLALLIAIAALWGVLREKVLVCLSGGEAVVPTVRAVGIVVNLLGAVAVGLIAWRGWLEPAKVLRLGLVFEVLVCAGLSLLDNFTLTDGTVPLTGIPRVCGVLLLAPPLVPVRWRARLLTTTLAAASFPVTWWIAGALGHPVPHGGEALLLIGPVILSAGLALVAARAVGQMTAEIQRARAEVREMGSYRMVERIGRGGMGEVWRAEHRMLARPAAIKVIRPENLVGISPEKHRIVLERFRREAQDTAALTSPHTVQVHDFGLTDEGTFYYVMELLDGVDLNSVLKEEGALPYERVVHLLSQACDSLAEAHALGLVHRDLKPANLMACRLGGHHDFVKVLDFGIVLRSETSGDRADDEDTPDAREAAERLTVEGNLLGTPTFMPPEMALGRRVDARADVYAIGCIAHMLLTGRPPYDAANSVEMLVRHIQHPVPRVAAQVAVPAELDSLVAACLAKSVAERPADARVLRDLLRRVPVERPWTEERAAAWWTNRAKSGAQEPAAA